MKIYTKKGDAGHTQLFGGVDIKKNDIKIRSYGTLDELNACLGVVLCDKNIRPELAQKLSRIQIELFHLGAELATPKSKSTKSTLLTSIHIDQLEQEIDQMEGVLEPLKNFIIPGGGAVSSFLHLARTVCRRAEREIVELCQQEELRPEVLKYINRLSDYLFVCARWSNFKEKIDDVVWR